MKWDVFLEKSELVNWFIWIRGTLSLSKRIKRDTIRKLYIACAYVNIILIEANHVK